MSYPEQRQQPYPGPYPPNQSASGPPYQPSYSAPPLQQSYPTSPVPQLYQTGYQQPPIVVALPPTSGMAVASMVLGIIGLLGGWCAFGIPCILAVLLGHGGLSDTKNGQKSGRGMAVAGLVMGYVVVGPALFFSIFFVFAGVLGTATGSQ